MRKRGTTRPKVETIGYVFEGQNYLYGEAMDLYVRVQQFQPNVIEIKQLTFDPEYYNKRLEK